MAFYDELQKTMALADYSIAIMDNSGNLEAARVEIAAILADMSDNNYVLSAADAIVRASKTRADIEASDIIATEFTAIGLDILIPSQLLLDMLAVIDAYNQNNGIGEAMDKYTAIAAQLEASTDALRQLTLTFYRMVLNALFVSARFPLYRTQLARLSAALHTYTRAEIEEYGTYATVLMAA